MIAFERGFRRLGWVVTALCLPIVTFVSYESSSHISGYDPEPVRNFAIGYKPAMQRAVHVRGAGLLWVPDDMPDPEVHPYVGRIHMLSMGRRSHGRMLIEEMAQRVRDKFPEKYPGTDYEVVSAVIARYPEYRDALAVEEFELTPRYEKRSVWATAVTIAVMIAIIILVQGSIYVTAWVFRGFKSAG